LKVVFLGMGAAGIACAKLLLDEGVGDIIGVDTHGVLHAGRTDLPPQKQWMVEHSNRGGVTGTLVDALRGADAFIGVSGPDLVKPEWLATMADDAIVFAMANPVPEIMPELVPGNVRIVATGRSDYPNQINNVLVFPGFFRGLLDAHAHTVDDQMKLAAAHALASLVSDTERSEEFIIASPFDRRVAPAVAAAVREAVAARR
jgi:malate dehydrogenase (oxaloacetate-decarboxylating)